ncbi:MAG: methylenetetrahydrofolate reductase [NAD(P)H] [Bifidobacterium aquikefiri]|uniref:Methylenetetrahydrofolate reductase n=1 Tax=Bifidobacterium aquikefiri TaxID=1653207 RepID=A0A261G6H8_9BIFI|nr:methylenetetrahydrofolate reductase [NAD(P)H] [Bifidobacterium aquikefiri]OZG67029.1 5,10-methylenetetrahydrofolate reductase [Bifidobacterium aquikefiri]
MFSLEVFPPRRTAPVGTIYDTLDGLQGMHPDFISVTYGTGKQADRTATARIANTIRTEYGIPAVAHLTARYADKTTIDHELDLFEDAGVKATLALRGDSQLGTDPCGEFQYASDLVRYIRERKPEMTVYAACYPECHPEAPNLDVDIDNLKTKVDAGANHLISQLFFDNEDYLKFLDKVRAAGITVPIEAGIMPVTNASRVKHMVGMCGSRIPSTVEHMIERWGEDPSAMQEAGIIYASAQISDLVARGVDGIHLYTMNKAVTTRRIWNNVRSLFA